MASLQPSPRELDVLRVLWRLGSGTVREVHERLYPDGGRAFNTVQTQLRILERKGLAEHRPEGQAFVYVPRYTRREAAQGYLRTVCGGSLEQGVRDLIEASDAGADQLRELERLVTRLRREREADSRSDPRESREPSRGS